MEAHRQTGALYFYSRLSAPMYSSLGILLYSPQVLLSVIDLRFINHLRCL